MINVLFIHDKADISGGEISLINLWENIDKKVFKVFLILPEEGKLAVRANKLNVDTSYFYIPKINVFNIKEISKTILYLSKFIKENKIKLIHTYTPRNNIIGVIVGRLNKVPVIWHERNLVLTGEEDFSKKFIRLPNRVICNSKAVAKRFFKKNMLPDNIKVILNGVNLDNFNPGINNSKLKKSLGIDRAKVVGIISPLSTKRKRIRYFLDAAALVLKKYANVKFIIVGSEFYGENPGEFMFLRKKAEELKIKENIIFTGFRDDIPEVLSCFDIFVHVAVKEACSRAIIESLACGKPVIAINDGGNPELVDNGLNGILVEPNDINGLVESIITLLKDDTTRKVMGHNARIKAQRFFDVKRNAIETEEVYKELLKG